MTRKLKINCWMETLEWIYTKMWALVVWKQLKNGQFTCFHANSQSELFEIPLNGFYNPFPNYPLTNSKPFVNPSHYTLLVTATFFHFVFFSGFASSYCRIYILWSKTSSCINSIYAVMGLVESKGGKKMVCMKRNATQSEATDEQKTLTYNNVWNERMWRAGIGTYYTHTHCDSVKCGKSDLQIVRGS